MSSPPLPHLVFASPRRLPKAKALAGRVVVLDVAFAADGLGSAGFDKTTRRFLEQLGPRLACWVDHHDHPAHAEFAGDERFVLATKAEHGACPEMIGPELVARIGPIDTIVAHFDLDGIYAAVKWILGGREPYAGADDDARAVDTRVGPVSPTAQLIDQALRANWADPTLNIRIVHYLISGLRRGPELETIREAAQRYTERAQASQRLAGSFHIADDIATIRIAPGQPAFDKTELLLLGQQRATVAVVIDNGNVTIAAPFDSGLDFLQLLGIGGGMPTRVSIPIKRLDDALRAIREALQERRR